MRRREKERERCGLNAYFALDRRHFIKKDKELWSILYSRIYSLFLFCYEDIVANYKNTRDFNKSQTHTQLSFRCVGVFQASILQCCQIFPFFDHIYKKKIAFFPHQMRRKKNPFIRLNFFEVMKKCPGFYWIN